MVIVMVVVINENTGAARRILESASVCFAKAQISLKRAFLKPMATRDAGVATVSLERRVRGVLRTTTAQ